MVTFAALPLEPRYAIISASLSTQGIFRIPLPAPVNPYGGISVITGRVPTSKQSPSSDASTDPSLDAALNHVFMLGDVADGAGYNGGLALVGNADRDEIRLPRILRLHGFGDHLLCVQPDLIGIVFDLARPLVNLLMFALSADTIRSERSKTMKRVLVVP